MLQAEIIRDKISDHIKIYWANIIKRMITENWGCIHIVTRASGDEIFETSTPRPSLGRSEAGQKYRTFALFTSGRYPNNCFYGTI